MSYRVGLVLLLTWCSAANAQDVPSHPRTNAPARSSQISRPAASLATSSNEQKLEPSAPAITPRREAPQADRARASASAAYSPWKMLGALLLAVGGIVGVAKLLKSLGVGPLGSTKPLPASVCEVLGVTQLPPRQTLYLLKLGQRILLLGSTGERLTLLAEVNEPQEVASMMHLSRSASEESSAPSFFSRLLNHASASKPTDNASDSDESSARRELEARLNAFAQS